MVHVWDCSQFNGWVKGVCLGLQSVPQMNGACFVSTTGEWCMFMIAVSTTGEWCMFMIAVSTTGERCMFMIAVSTTGEWCMFIG